MAADRYIHDGIWQRDIPRENQQMTPKLEQAARQALAAFEYMEYDGKCVTALREALAEPKRYNHETGSVFVLEQAEQEPVACERCEELAADKGTWYRLADMFSHRNEELKSVLGKALNLIEGEWPEGDEVAQPVIDAIKATFVNQPAPVRTKDLTDDEIDGVMWIGGLTQKNIRKFARAVIAAYKEKNK